VKKRFFQGLGVNVFLLGLVSLLTDLSSEMVMPILPMYITALGGTAFAVGLTGGLGDSVASALKVLSGYWSDRFGVRKPFVFWGYALSAMAKLSLAFSTVWQHAMIARSAERVGKGLREAPRDAIIADSAEYRVRGKAFGVHRAMDTTGAIGGSLLAFLLYWYLDFRFEWIILACAAIAFVALVPFFRITELKREPQRNRGLGVSFKALPKRLRRFVLIAAIFGLGNFTYMFFVLRAQDVFGEGASERTAVGLAILLYALYNAVYAVMSIPAGVLSDRIGRGRILVLGYLLFGMTCVGFAFLDSRAYLVALFVVYGLVHALVVGAERAYACDLAPEDARGTALGTLHAFMGLVALPAGIIAGTLWDSFGAWATFTYGGGLGLLAGVLMLRFCASPGPPAGECPDKGVR
jgi:MFS family permease